MAASLLVTARGHRPPRVELIGAMAAGEAETRGADRRPRGRRGRRAGEAHATRPARCSTPSASSPGWATSRDGDTRARVPCARSSSPGRCRRPRSTRSCAACSTRVRPAHARAGLLALGRRVHPRARRTPRRSRTATRASCSSSPSPSRRDAGGGPRRRARLARRRRGQLAHPHGTGGVYANFPETGRDPWDRAYHGANRERLLAVKRRYDPAGVFGGVAPCLPDQAAIRPCGSSTNFLATPESKSS